MVERSINTEPILTEVLKSYDKLNSCIRDEEVPNREGTSKSCNTCRWCNYVNTCWVV